MSDINSSQQWEGSRPCKFQRGRQRSNFPVDELDAILQSNHLSRPSGRRYIPVKQTMGSTEIPKNQGLKTFSLPKSNIFDDTLQKKLFKAPPKQPQQQKLISHFCMSSIGRSKMKELKQGKKTTGIYRNFYKLQEKQN